MSWKTLQSWGFGGNLSQLQIYKTNPSLPPPSGKLGQESRVLVNFEGKTNVQSCCRRTQITVPCSTFRVEEILGGAASPAEPSPGKSPAPFLTLKQALSPRGSYRGD